MALGEVESESRKLCFIKETAEMSGRISCVSPGKEEEGHSREGDQYEQRHTPRFPFISLTVLLALPP